MADEKLVVLTELTTPTGADKTYVVDVSDTTDSPEGTSKQMRLDAYTNPEGIARYDAVTDLPATGVVTTSYKVTADPTPANNGFYTWTGSAYTQDAGLYGGSIVLGDTEAVSGDTTRTYLDDADLPYLSPLLEIGLNKFDKTQTTTDGFFINTTTGALSVQANGKVSYYIPIESSTAYFINGRNAGSSVSTMAFYDVSFVLLSPLGANYTVARNATFTSPATAKYMRFTVAYAGVGDVNSVMLNLGTTGVTLEDYTKQLSNYYKKSEVDAKDTIIDDKIIVLDNVLTKNLFNKTDLVDGFINVSSGAIAGGIPAENFQTANYIPIDSSTDYFISGRLVNANVQTMAFYDVSFVLLPPLGANYTVGYNSTFTSPATAKYVRFTVSYSETPPNVDDIQLELGTEQTTYVDYSVTEKIPQVKIPELDLVSELITIKNSDKITIFGNSFSEAYGFHKKHYLDSLSMFSDYQFRNFSEAGDDLLGILARIRDNESRFGTVTIDDFGSTYGIIACLTNNEATSALNADTFYENNKKLANAIETLGAKPILSTEHKMPNQIHLAALKRLQNEQGYMFMDWGRTSNKLYNNDFFTPFWQSQHPGTRTNWLWVNGMKPYLDTLPRVERGLKIFRIRNESGLGSINDLIYENNIDRAILFDELVIGQLELTEATEKYFDRLDTGSALYATNADEYLSLQKFTEVAIGDYCLTEVVTPYDSENLTYFKLNFTGSGVTKVYVKKTLGLLAYLPSDGTNGTYQANFDNPVGEWYELTLTADSTFGFSVEVPSTLFKEAVNFDKLSFLFEGTSIALKNVSAECNGVKQKIRASKQLTEKQVGTELLTDILLDNGTTWTSIATVPSYTPIVNINDAGESESLPSGITTVREIYNTDFLQQSLSTVLDGYDNTNVQIRILARYFPTYISSDLLWASSDIVRESYDCANLTVYIKNGSNDEVKVAEEPIGLYWREFIFNTVLEDGSNDIIIKSLINTLQVAKVTVQEI